MAKRSFTAVAATALALALHGCGPDAPRSPGSSVSNSVMKQTKGLTVRQPGNTPETKRSKLWNQHDLPEPLVGADQYKQEFVHYLYGSTADYRWNRLDDKMAQIEITNLDGAYSAWNGIYYPHPSRPFLWVKGEGDSWKAGLLKQGENFVIRYYKQARNDNVEALTRCWWIGSWKIDTKTQKPNDLHLKDLTWHCQSYNTFTQVPERGWHGEAGNKMYISNAGADRQVVDK